MGAGDAKYFTLYRDISVPWMFLLAHKLMKMKMKLTLSQALLQLEGQSY
jgi:hypothetical protein